MLPAMGAVMRFDIENLVAEGDAVVARCTIEVTPASGEKVAARGLTYYSLADGIKIVEDDPITTPNLMQVLAPPRA